MTNLSDRKNLYCVILAGGDGRRLRALTRHVSGDERPKQFCPFLGGSTPLCVTRRRVAQRVDRERTFFVVTRQHNRYYSELLADAPCSRVLVQPKNRGTAAAVLLSLFRLTQIDAQSSVVFLPSDHYFCDENGFLEAVDDAFERSEGCGNPLVLLGARPSHPEVEYGWIEPGSPVPSADGIRECYRVTRFWEKPTASVARGLLDLGCFWNTFVMVGRAQAFLELVQSAAPELFEMFRRFHVGSCDRSAERLYRRIPIVDFSKTILANGTASLAVTDMGDVGWSDLGQPQRVATLASCLGLDFGWRDFSFHPVEDEC
jgi:mannose-1-phosphate guanylyltransferase